MITKLLDGKKALVTGGTAGIGRAIALKFAEQGAEVIIFGTNEERGKEIVSLIGELPDTPTAHFYSLDVSKIQEVDKAVESLLNKVRSVDILVNNAGITRDKLLLKMSEDDWDRVMEVNVKSCYAMCKALTFPMMKARQGRIINMSSVVGLTGNVGQVNYASSKAAVIGLTKALAKELAPRNILVNCIAPGYIDTPMTGRMGKKQQGEILEEIPLRRMGSSEEVANVALFLAGPLASYITGQVIPVDGGLSL